MTYFKVGTSQFETCYSTDGGLTWGDCADIYLAFDGTGVGSCASTAARTGTEVCVNAQCQDDNATLQGCLENMDAIVSDYGGPHKGAFFKESRAAGCFSAGGGIVFANHEN